MPSSPKVQERAPGLSAGKNMLCLRLFLAGLGDAEGRRGPSPAEERGESPRGHGTYGADGGISLRGGAQPDPECRQPSPVWGLEMWELRFCKAYMHLCPPRGVGWRLSPGDCPQESPGARFNPWKQQGAREPLAVPCPGDTHRAAGGQILHPPRRPGHPSGPGAPPTPDGWESPSQGGVTPSHGWRGSLRQRPALQFPSLLPFLLLDFSGDLGGCTGWHFPWGHVP